MPRYLNTQRPAHRYKAAASQTTGWTILGSPVERGNDPDVIFDQECAAMAFVLRHPERVAPVSGGKKLKPRFRHGTVSR